jgi:branched-chain amino acid transport system ATP-binding protein
MADSADGTLPPTQPVPYARREVVLEARSLQVTYNRLAVAIEGVSLAVPKASIVAVLGANGAGKTSLMRALSGFLPAEVGALTAGTVLLNGAPLTGRGVHEIAQSGIVLVPERNKVFVSLTVEENLAAVPTRSGGNRAAMRELIFEVFPRLTDLGKRLGGLLSGGERQMLGVSRALIADPLVLLVDELSLGIAPLLVARMMASMQRIRELKGIGVLIVEQNAAAALNVADHAYIMQTGRIVLEGDPTELLGNEQVRRLYLGMGDTGENRAYGNTTSRRAHRWQI